MARIFGFKVKEQRTCKNQINGHLDNGDDEEISGLSQLYSPEQEQEQESAAQIRDEADVLSEMGKISGEQLSELRRIQNSKGNCDICQLIKEQNLAHEPDISMARANLHGCEFQKIEPEKVDKKVFNKLDLEYIKSNRIMPIAVKDEILVVATSRPADLFIIEDVKRQTQMKTETVVCLDEDIDKVCETFDNEKIDYDIDDIINDMTDVEVMQDQQEESDDLEKMAGQSPIIKFVNYLISNAVREGASDIHIEPKEKYMRTRYRIDGVLFEMKQSPLKMHPAIVSSRFPSPAGLSIYVSRRSRRIMEKKWSSECSTVNQLREA